MKRDLRLPGRAERPDAHVRREYLIDRFRVVFETGSRWFCPCAEFTAMSECCHTREAAGRRAAQAQIADQVATGQSQFARQSRRTLRP